MNFNPPTKTKTVTVRTKCGTVAQVSESDSRVPVGTKFCLIEGYNLLPATHRHYLLISRIPHKVVELAELAPE